MQHAMEVYKEASDEVDSMDWSKPHPTKETRTLHGDFTKAMDKY